MEREMLEHLIFRNGGSSILAPSVQTNVLVHATSHVARGHRRFSRVKRMVRDGRSPHVSDVDLATPAVPVRRVLVCPVRVRLSVLAHIKCSVQTCGTLAQCIGRLSKAQVSFDRDSFDFAPLSVCAYAEMDWHSRNSQVRK